MEITVISEDENPMLHRTDVRFRVSHAEATPDRLAVRDSLAARLNKDADEVVIRKLDTKFGMRETVGEAKVYQGAAFAQDVEQAYMLARNKIGVEDEGEDGEAVETETPAEPDVDPEEAEPQVEDDEAEPDEGEAEVAEDETDDGEDSEAAQTEEDEDEDVDTEDAADDEAADAEEAEEAEE